MGDTPSISVAPLPLFEMLHIPTQTLLFSECPLLAQSRRSEFNIEHICKNFVYLRNNIDSEPVSYHLVAATTRLRPAFFA